MYDVGGEHILGMFGFKLDKFIEDLIPKLICLFLFLIKLYNDFFSASPLFDLKFIAMGLWSYTLIWFFCGSVNMIFSLLNKKYKFSISNKLKRFSNCFYIKYIFDEGVKGHIKYITTVSIVMRNSLMVKQ